LSTSQIKLFDEIRVDRNSSVDENAAITIDDYQLTISDDKTISQGLRAFSGNDLLNLGT
jgi:hypothetical protein